MDNILIAIIFFVLGAVTASLPDVEIVFGNEEKHEN